MSIEFIEGEPPMGYARGRLAGSPLRERAAEITEALKENPDTWAQVFTDPDPKTARAKYASLVQMLNKRTPGVTALSRTIDGVYIIFAKFSEADVAQDTERIKQSGPKTLQGRRKAAGVNYNIPLHLQGEDGLVFDPAVPPEPSEPLTVEQLVAAAVAGRPSAPREEVLGLVEQYLQSEKRFFGSDVDIDIEARAKFFERESLNEDEA